MSVQPLPFADGAVVIQNDARRLPLGDASVDLIVTSPPYFALRSYRDDGEHYDGQIGSEATPQQFVDALSECMVEWGRVLKPSGSVWVNLGDKYAGSGGHNNSGVGKKQTFGTNWRDLDRGIVAASRRNAPDRYIQASDGIRAKSLMGLPWRFAIAQIDAGWILRAEVVWSKPNSLPESVTDRVRRSHETWFHFTKEPRYYSAMDEIREPHKDVSLRRAMPHRANVLAHEDTHEVDMTQACHPLGRLPGSVWTIPSEPLIVPDEVRAALDLPDHFAAFPQEWPRRIILGWSPLEGIVLDPFGGTGTVAGVARTLGRFGISNDLSADYNRLACWRIWESGHFTKTEQRTWADRQTTMEPS